MPNQLRIALDDFDGDTKTTSIAARDEAYATQEAKLNTLGTQLLLWSSGRDHRGEHILQQYDNGPGKATSPVAQGATMLILEVQDTVTGVIYREKLPMPNLTRANDAGGDPAWLAVGQGSQSLTIINPDHDGWGTLKTAYDAVGVSPEGNNTILVRAYVEE